MKRIRFARTVVFAVSIIILTQGCSSYYSVKDRSSGETYFTTEIEQVNEGVRFKNEKTSALVTIQNFDVTRLEKDDFFYLLNQPPIKMIAPVIPRSQGEPDPDVSVRIRE